MIYQAFFNKKVTVFERCRIPFGRFTSPDGITCWLATVVIDSNVVVVAQNMIPDPRGLGFPPKEAFNVPILTAEGTEVSFEKTEDITTEDFESTEATRIIKELGWTSAN